MGVGTHDGKLGRTQLDHVRAKIGGPGLWPSGPANRIPAHLIRRDDGRIEPDTNIVERPIRSIAIGNCNSLFAGDNGGAETWAILSTLIQTAWLNGVDPETWLADVLERMISGATTNNRLAELLVWNWKAARDQAEAAA